MYSQHAPIKYFKPSGKPASFNQYRWNIDELAVEHQNYASK